MGNNICKNCHLENPENAKYCHSCGKEIILPDQKTITQESKNRKDSKELSKNHPTIFKNKMILFCIFFMNIF